MQIRKKFLKKGFWALLDPCQVPTETSIILLELNIKLKNRI